MFFCTDAKGSMQDMILGFDTYSPRIVTGRRWNARRRYWCGEIDALRRECCEESREGKKCKIWEKDFMLSLTQF